MAWCSCPDHGTRHDYVCPPNGCRIHAGVTANTFSAADPFDSAVIYRIIHAAGVLAVMGAAPGAKISSLVQPGDTKLFAQYGLELDTSVTPEVMAQTHDRYLMDIEANLTELRGISAAELLGVLPRLLVVPEDQWNETRGLES